MSSEIIKFRETKEFKETLSKAKQLITTNNQSDLIRILCNLGLERLQEAYNGIESVTHTLKMSETENIASSIKIYLLQKKKDQVKQLSQKQGHSFY